MDFVTGGILPDSAPGATDGRLRTSFFFVWSPQSDLNR